MEVLFLIFILVVIFVFFIGKIKAKRQKPENKVKDEIVHRKVEYLATENERKLFYALRKSLNEKYLVHCQTSLIALVDPIEYKYKSKAWSKRMDFVITDTATKILCVIELDDASHKQKKRMKRDEYVNSALENNHVLIRLQTQNFYEPEKLAELFETKLGIKNHLLQKSHSERGNKA